MARTQLDSSMVAALNSTFVGLGRNRLLNAGFEIDQTNGGGAVSINSATAVYIMDQWVGRGQATDGVFTVGRASTGTLAGFQNCARITITTADASIGATQFYHFRTPIEGFTTRDWNYGAAGAKTLTLSFWVRSSVTGTFAVALGNNGATRSYVSTYTVNVADTWEYKSITVLGDTTGSWANLTTGVQMLVYFNVGAGATMATTANTWAAGEFYTVAGTTNLIATNAATMDLTGIQLEIGSASTPFENRPMGFELWLCQRYYETSYGRDFFAGNNTNDGLEDCAFLKLNTNSVSSNLVHFRNTKRAAPTMTFYTNTGTLGSWPFSNAAGTLTNRTVTANRVHERGFNIGQTTTEELYARGHWVADARL